MATRTIIEHKPFPQLVRWAREKRGLSCRVATTRAKLKQGQIEAFENGESRPTLPQLRRMAEAYDVHLAYFFLPKVPRWNPLGRE